ncbi:hypothetical protein LCM20_15980 [Halobacillus litoralis]|uniref:hypothetical protein n=1 Tax=Halobacillus litoralis TaxID=45668 RepID=UPI001CD4E5F0|nr:hypothetical protein [Halobacillus litoralis]MCA0972107.1 hypothetical protein [Halobacillus litoralis]
MSFLVSFASFFVLQAFDLLSVWSIAGVFILIMAVLFIPLLFTTMFETDVDKVERFLLRNKKNLNFYMIYALAHQEDDQVKNLTEKLIKKSKNPTRKALYQVVEALYFDDVVKAKAQLEQITLAEYRAYYEAAVLLKEGHVEEARVLAGQFKKPWMRETVLAEVEKESGNPDAGQKHMEKAIESCRGLQRYTLHKTYERDFAS